MPRGRRQASDVGKASCRGVSTTNILLEGAAWNFINIRKTAKQHNLPSEASFRFSRGVHPAMAEQGVRRGLQLMAAWSGGKVAPGLVDEYPLKPVDPTVTVTTKDVKRWIGIDLTAQKIAELLSHLEFECVVDGRLRSMPGRRLTGWILARGSSGSRTWSRRWRAVTAMTTSPKRAWPMPCRRRSAIRSSSGRSASVTSWSDLGLQEVVTYRLTSPERESRLSAIRSYVELANPIAPERACDAQKPACFGPGSRREKCRVPKRSTLFEIGSVFVPVKNELPDEPHRLPW